jgi:epoxyqueuosine reductase
MPTLEDKIKQLARESGAALVGIASRDRLSDAPPSGDPGYLLPSTRSIISFAVPFDRTVLRNFFSKKDWLSHCADKKDLHLQLYGVNDRLEEFLRGEGYEARGVDGNCVYRPENGSTDPSQMTEFVPDFSHRYGAIAAGLGRVGWSGNLLTPEYGAAVILGTVLTSAELQSDPLLEENPCDGCKLCAAVCPVEMIERRKSVTVTIAGITEEIAEKRPNTCCWIGCGDYHGALPSGKGTNWSPYRVDYPLPENKQEMDALFRSILEVDPDMQQETSQYADYRAAVHDPQWTYNATCGHCANICWKTLEDRKENRRLIVRSGAVVLTADGTRQVCGDEVVELETPFRVRVAVLKPEGEKLRTAPEGEIGKKAHLPRDREILVAAAKLLKAG